MPGTPSKAFELEIAPLWPHEPQGVPGTDIAPGLKPFLEPTRLDLLAQQSVVPLGLRWRVRPEMGMPRTAFSVWRRDRRRDDPIDVKFGTSAVNGFHRGKGVFHLPTSPLYILLVAVDNNDPADVVTVRALNAEDEPLPQQSVEVPANTNRIVRFQHPFISGFSCQGNSFELTSAIGVTMQHWIDLKDEWELIETVGLPANETAARTAAGQRVLRIAGPER